MSVDTSIEELPSMHQPDQFDFCQGHSSNEHLQWESMALNLYIFNIIATAITKLDI